MTEQSYNPEAYKELMEFLSRHSLSDGDKFCADLMRESSRHKSLGMLNSFHIYVNQPKSKQLEQKGYDILLTSSE